MPSKNVVWCLNKKIMKQITLKNKKDIWTLTLVGDEVTIKKATLQGLASFVRRAQKLDIEPIRGAMQLAGMLVNDIVLSKRERARAQSYYTILNEKYRELLNHT